MSTSVQAQAGSLPSLILYIAAAPDAILMVGLKQL
jgi:hypothetical protein